LASTVDPDGEVVFRVTVTAVLGEVLGTATAATLDDPVCG
jgi:hypothetical protein